MKIRISSSASLRKNLSLLVTAASLSFGNTSQAANLVINGDFETLSLGLVNQYIVVPTLFTSTPKSILFGWTSEAVVTNAYTFVANSNVSVDSPLDAGNGLFGPSTPLYLWSDDIGGVSPFLSSPTGGNFYGTDGDPSFRGKLSQQISGLTIGQQYNLQFSWALSQFNEEIGDTTGSWEVTMGNDTFNTQTESNPSKGFTGWFTETFTFTADATTENLSFLGIGAPAGLPPIELLDGVSIMQIPEPTSSLFLLSATVFSMFIRRRNNS